MLRVMVRYSNHEALEGKAPLGLRLGTKARQVVRGKGKTWEGGCESFE